MEFKFLINFIIFLAVVPDSDLFVKEEMTLIEMNGLIKSVLNKEQADVKGCIGLLERFLLLNLTPMMLLKNPAVVETIKRLRRYVGNTEYWGYSEEEIEEFNEKAEKIRGLAQSIYHQIKVGRAVTVTFDRNIQNYYD